MRRQKLKGLLPLTGAEQLRIVDERRVLRVKDGAGASINRAGEGAPSSFVDADDGIQFVPRSYALLKKSQSLVPHVFLLSGNRKTLPVRTRRAIIVVLLCKACLGA
jgi:hypothetical protein